MKKMIVLVLGISLWGCSKKTNILDASKISNKTQSINNSSKQKDVQFADKSIIIITKDVDTAVLINGQPLIGYINSVGDSVIHFDNSDLDLDLEFNKATGTTKATVTPKVKLTNVHIHEKKAIYNDIINAQTVKLNLNTNIKTKTDSIIKHTVSHTDPAITFKSFKGVFIWLILIAVVIAIAIYLLNKFSMTAMLWGWLKKVL